MKKMIESDLQERLKSLKEQDLDLIISANQMISSLTRYGMRQLRIIA